MARDELLLALIMLIQSLLVKWLISLLVDVVEDIFFDQLVIAGVLPLVAFRITTLRRGRLNRILLIDLDGGYLTVFSRIVIIDQDLSFLKSVTSTRL